MIIETKWKRCDIAYDTKNKELIILGRTLPSQNTKNSLYINKKENITKKDIKKITFKNDGTRLPKNSDYLFANFPYLEELDLTPCDFKNTQSMNNILYNNQFLKKLTIKNVKNNKLVYIDTLISNMRNLETVCFENIELTNLEKIDTLFKNTPKLETTDVRNINLPNLTQITAIHCGHLDKTHLTPNTTALNQLPLKTLGLYALLGYNNNKNIKETHHINIRDLDTSNLQDFAIIISSTVESITLPKNTSNINKFTLLDQSFVKHLYKNPYEEITSVNNIFNTFTETFCEYHMNYKQPISLNMYKNIDPATFKSWVLKKKDYPGNTSVEYQNEPSIFTDYAYNQYENYTLLMYILRKIINKDVYTIDDGNNTPMILDLIEDKEFLDSIIQSKIYFKNISLNDLKNPIITYLTSNKDKKTYEHTLNYLKAYEYERDYKTVLKQIDLISKIA